MKNTYFYRWRKIRNTLGEAGRIIGKCACGNNAYTIKGGEPVCPRCAEIERKMFGTELSRGVCGYESRGVLATTSGRETV